MLELYLTYLILLGAARLLFQLSQLATAIVVGGALMAYVHRKDLASAWLKSFLRCHNCNCLHVEFGSET